jgi:hypothetical protein
MNDTIGVDSAKVESTDDDLKITRLVVAVHGIGSQFRYATIQSVASRFMAHCGRQMTLPLGAFHPLKLITEPDSPELGAYLFEPRKTLKATLVASDLRRLFGQIFRSERPPQIIPRKTPRPGPGRL